MTRKKALDDTRDPWERQPYESAKAFEAFRVYRDMGPTRSYARVAQTLGKSKTLIDRWGREWDWQQRVRAWDDEQERIAIIAHNEEIREMNIRQARQARNLQAKAIEALSKLAAEHLKPNDVLRFMIDGAKLERLAMGEPETIAENRSNEGAEAVAAIEEFLTDPGFITALQRATAEAAGEDPGGGQPRPDDQENDGGSTLVDSEEDHPGPSGPQESGSSKLQRRRQIVLVRKGGDLVHEDVLPGNGDHDGTDGTPG